MVRASSVDVAVSPVDFSNEELSWTTPAEIFDASVRRLRKAALLAAIRVTLISSALMWCAVHWLGPKLSQVDWSKTNLILIGMVVLQMSAPYVASFLSRNPGAYRLGTKGIRRPVGDPQLLRWDRLQCFTLGRADSLPQYQMITLYTLSGIARTIYLPEGQLADRIIARVAEHVPRREPEKIVTSLTPSEWLIALAVTSAVSISLGLYLGISPQMHGYRSLIPLGLVLWHIAGPGTLSAILLSARGSTAPKLATAIIFNVVGFTELSCCAVVAAILRLPN